MRDFTSTPSIVTITLSNHHASTADDDNYARAFDAARGLKNRKQRRQAAAIARSERRRAKRRGER